MKLLICGSRTIQLDTELLNEIINEHNLTHITEILSGGAHGPDTAAIQWAKEHNIPCKIMRPDWKKYGKKAGILRNKEMAEECDVCLAIWDCTSVGTASTIAFVEELEKPVIIVECPF